MNPLSAVSWSVRALRGHSVTFAGLFATGVLGVSVLAGFRHLLGRIGLPWYVWFIAPILLVGYLAKKEVEWIPDVGERRRWARRLLFGSIVLALVLAWLRPNAPTAAAGVVPPGAAR